MSTVPHQDDVWFFGADGRVFVNGVEQPFLRWRLTPEGSSETPILDGVRAVPDEVCHEAIFGESAWAREVFPPPAEQGGVDPAVWTDESRRMLEHELNQRYSALVIPPSVIPPSDLGLEGAVPLPPEEPPWAPPDDQGLDWAIQNRRINALLMGRESYDEIRPPRKDG